MNYKSIDPHTKVRIPDVKYSVRILGYLGMLPISSTLEQRYGKCFSFLNIFSNMFIFQNHLYCVSALGIPDESYIHEGLSSTQCYLIFLNLELQDWREKLERIWLILKRYNAINSVLILNTSRAGYNPADPLLEEMQAYGVPVKTLTETDENKFTDIICTILEKCKRHEEISKTSDSSRTYDVYKKQLSNNKANSTKCILF